MDCQKYEECWDDVLVFLTICTIEFALNLQSRNMYVWYGRVFWKIFKKEIGAFLSGIARHNIASSQRYKRAMPTNIFSTYMQIYSQHICKYIFNIFCKYTLNMQICSKYICKYTLNIYKHIFNIYANILLTYMQISFKHIWKYTLNWTYAYIFSTYMQICSH